MVNIGFISTRFAGQDEVSLASANWAALLRATGKRLSLLYGGLYNRHPDILLCVPYAHFTFADNKWINRCICNWFSFNGRIGQPIRKGTGSLKRMHHLFLKKYHFVPSVFLREKNSSVPGQFSTVHKVTSGANELWPKLLAGRGFEATNAIELLIFSGNPAIISMRGGLCFES